MPRRIILLPYKIGSEAVKALKDKLLEFGQRVLRVKQDSTTFRRKPNDLLVYYGGNLTIANGLNVQRSIASNKLSAFQAFQEAGLSTVSWTTNKNDIPEDWKQIVARATLSGHSGDGITIHTNGEQLPDVPLYTKYVKKTYECRIHIFKGRMIDAQIKRKVRDAEETDTFIRNIHTGWVYCREDFVPDPRAIELAIAACNDCHLDFGAVDIIYNRYYNQFYLLEVNTAPGLTGTTLTNYANAIIGELNA